MIIREPGDESWHYCKQPANDTLLNSTLSSLFGKWSFCTLLGIIWLFIRVLYCMWMSPFHSWLALVNFHFPAQPKKCLLLSLRWLKCLWIYEYFPVIYIVIWHTASLFCAFILQWWCDKWEEKSCLHIIFCQPVISYASNFCSEHKKSLIWTKLCVHICWTLSTELSTLFIQLQWCSLCVTFVSSA